MKSCSECCIDALVTLELFEHFPSVDVLGPCEMRANVHCVLIVVENDVVVSI